VVDTQYAGLIGKFLNPEEKVFPGYTPVVTPPEIAVQPGNTAPTLSSPAEPAASATASTSQPAPQPNIDREAIRQIVLELLAEQQASENQPTPQPEPQPEVPSEIMGCTDSQALNYLPEATKDDGSCVYPWSSPTPEVPSPEIPAVETTSPTE